MSLAVPSPAHAVTSKYLITQAVTCKRKIHLTILGAALLHLISRTFPPHNCLWSCMAGTSRLMCHLLCRTSCQSTGRPDKIRWLCMVGTSRRMCQIQCTKMRQSSICQSWGTTGYLFCKQLESLLTCGETRCMRTQHRSFQLWYNLGKSRLCYHHRGTWLRRKTALMDTSPTVCKVGIDRPLHLSRHRKKRQSIGQPGNAPVPYTECSCRQSRGHPDTTTLHGSTYNPFTN